MFWASQFYYKRILENIMEDYDRNCVINQIQSMPNSNGIYFMIKFTFF